MPAPLFRQQVLDAKRSSWLGGISLAQPVSLWVLTVFASVAAASIGILLVLGSYTRRATVIGQLVPTRGMATVLAPATGVRVPRQTVTTLGSGVADLAAQGKSRIIKNISQGGYQESGPCFNKTEYFREECADGLSSERLSAPVMLQEYIEKDYEIRAVVIGAAVYGAAVDSARSEMTSLDSRYWGMAGLTYYRIGISDSERDALVKINQLLGLSYSAMDLIRGQDGALYFLEANPSGQWGFVEMLTGFPITEKIVDLLESSS